MSTPKTVSARALARHLGVNHSIVNREIAKGPNGRLRGSLDDDGRLRDLEGAAAAWRATRRPRADDDAKRACPGRTGGATVGDDSIGGARQRARAARPARNARTDPVSSEEPVSYAEARARRELAMAQLAELELQKELGLYIFTDDARRETKNLFHAVRDRLLGVHVRIAQRYFNQVIDHKAVADIQEIIREALEELGTDGPWWARVLGAARARGLPVEEEEDDDEEEDEDEEKIPPRRKRIDQRGRS